MLSEQRAGDGRHSPLKYTRSLVPQRVVPAGDGRHSPLKYTSWEKDFEREFAGDGRHSPLKYTRPRRSRSIRASSCAVCS